MKKYKLLSMAAIAISVFLMLCGCSTGSDESGASSQNGSANETGYQSALDTSDMFTDRDLQTNYDAADAKEITVSDTNSQIKITEAGVYVISGTTQDGMIIVDAADTDKVQIVLNGASITSKTSAALYVKSADKVFVTTVKGTENTLANGGSFTAIDDNNIDGAVFSKDDIVFSGEGTLNIVSPAAHGIVGKDDVKFTSGTYIIKAASHGVDANDSIRVTNASLTVTAGKDGLHCDNDEDTEKGYVYIESGTFDIDVDDDGIHAITILQINGGTFNIKAAEGLEATIIVINDGTISIEASDDGINAAKKSNIATPSVTVNGGSITITMGAGDTDGIDSNGNIIINGGTVNITGNSSFDYDGTGVINGGAVIVNGSEVTTLPNQMMGGPGGMRGDMGDNMPDTITSATPNANGEQPPMPGNNSERPTPPEFNSENGERPTPPNFGGSQDGNSSNRPQKPSGGFKKSGSTANNSNA